MAFNITSHAARSTGVRGNAAKLVVKEVIAENHSVFDMPGRQIPDEEGGRAPGIPEEPSSKLPICIIGAGCAGLYAAMILDTLGIPYEILEASNRIGGRIYTHRFNGKAGHDVPINDPARYDYVDIGAMRYPNIDFMTRVFDLFKRLKMDKDGLLIHYKYSSDNTFQNFNGVLYNSADPAVEDIFCVSEANGGAVPDEWVIKGVDNVAADIFKPYADKFKTLPFPEAWEFLTRQDPKSTRGYLLEKQFPETVVEWLETFQSATGLYNNAFVESTMDAMDFGSSSAVHDAGTNGTPLPYDWYCIDGGSDHMTDRMTEAVKFKPVLGTRVTKIASTSSGEMDVTFHTLGGAPTKKTYSQVICTVPLGCLAAIEIPREDLSYMKRMAIRSLNYDTSTKIALKFERRWWEDPAVMNGRPIKGGISSTDLPIRTCVYPSYGFQAWGTVSGVMLASYTWAQDAQRLGGLAQPNGTEADKLLIDLTLRNLSELHGVPIEKMGKLVDHYAYDWHNDVNARGAFALFGPGQFGHTNMANSLFASMKAPAADGKLHIAGEATSAHHAWVLGALNSAWRAVYNALGKVEDPTAKRKELEKEWGIPDEEDVKALKELALLSRYDVL